MPEKQNQTYRVMPHNAEAEEALLGSILIDTRTADQLVPSLRAEDFYSTANRTVFAAMRALLDESVVVDVVSVADRLMLEGKLDEVGGMDYLASLTESVVFWFVLMWRFIIYYTWIILGLGMNVTDMAGRIYRRRKEARKNAKTP